MLILQIESNENYFTDTSDDSDSTIKDDSDSLSIDYDPESGDWLKEILMEEPFNLGLVPTCSAMVFALENWFRNENIERKLTKEEQDLLLKAGKELKTWPSIKGLEWVIDGW